MLVACFLVSSVAALAASAAAAVVVVLAALHTVSFFFKFSGLKKLVKYNRYKISNSIIKINENSQICRLRRLLLAYRIRANTLYSATLD